MDQLVTLPQWECRAPAPFRRRGEHYWNCAEVPLDSGWLFVLNTPANPAQQLPERSLIAVGIERLLSLLDELGMDGVTSVYQMTRGAPDDSDALILNRLTSILVGEDQDDGWRKIFSFVTDDGSSIADLRDHEAVPRLVNRVEVARFNVAKVTSG